MGGCLVQDKSLTTHYHGEKVKIIKADNLSQLVKFATRKRQKLYLTSFSRRPTDGQTLHLHGGLPRALFKIKWAVLLKIPSTPKWFSFMYAGTRQSRGMFMQPSQLYACKLRLTFATRIISVLFLQNWAHQKEGRWKPKGTLLRVFIRERNLGGVIYFMPRT